MRHFYLTPFLLLFTITFAGCCCPAINAAREAARETQSRNNMKQIGLAAINHQTIHDAWPDSLEDVRDQPSIDLDTLLVNPLTLDDPGYEYVKPVDENAAWSSTVILYQLRNGARYVAARWVCGWVGPLKRCNTGASDMRAFAYCLATTLLVTSSSGCCCPPITAAREAAQRAVSMDSIHNLCQAITRYHVEESKWPDNLQQLATLLGTQYPQILVNPLTGDDPGYEYARPESNISPPNTVLIYQLRNGQRDLSLEKGYTDGSVR